MLNYFMAPLPFERVPLTEPLAQLPRPPTRGARHGSDTQRLQQEQVQREIVGTQQAQQRREAHVHRVQQEPYQKESTNATDSATGAEPRRRMQMHRTSMVAMAFLSQQVVGNQQAGLLQTVDCWFSETSSTLFFPSAHPPLSVLCRPCTAPLFHQHLVHLSRYLSSRTSREATTPRNTLRRAKKSMWRASPTGPMRMH